MGRRSQSEKKKEALVEDVTSGNVEQTGWNIDPCRRLKDSEIQEVVEFTRILDNHRMLAVGDEREWSSNPQGTFSISSCYNWLMHDQGRIAAIKFPSDYIWNKTIPPNISFLVWAAAIRAVLTLSMLSRRGIVIENILCPFCNSSEESVEHLFLHCSFVGQIWEHVLQQLSIVWVHPTTVLEFVWKWKLKISIKPLVFLRYCVPFAIWWIVWLERNDILIAKKQLRKPMSTLVLDIKSLLFSWSINVVSFRNIKFGDFVFDWASLFRE
ncbi:uncharacterized protein LOC113311274 [Papaver somniferum]|uniref:uncharacterized protein LOC113311274 n=1 Tax=Papaver somniferum TaxID=3469 RepID=UPI000E702789|nr:uncharacterized protein LOC113311274 [Papaver somniferum]